MQKVSRLNEEVQEWRGVANRLHDTLELAQLDDPTLLEELTTETDALSEIVKRMSLQALLSGPYDVRTRSLPSTQARAALVCRTGHQC